MKMIHQLFAATTIALIAIPSFTTIACSALDMIDCSLQTHQWVIGHESGMRSPIALSQPIIESVT